jgi:hypothetical protein
VENFAMRPPTDDVLEILQLYARYNTAIDGHDPKAFSACFVEEGRLDSGSGVFEGHKAIAGFAAGVNSNLPGMRHYPTNIVVDVEGRSATGSAFLTCYDVRGGFRVTATGRYADRLTRTESGWRFTQRAFTPDI